LIARGGRLFFTHDPVVAMGTVAKDAKGRYRVVDERETLVELAA
jgi:hypothetical protein